MIDVCICKVTQDVKNNIFFARFVANFQLRKLAKKL